MNTAWYVLRITDSDETLMRCSPTGYETVPIRPAGPVSDDPEVEAATIPADTPSEHSPVVPVDVGAMQTGDTPRATDVTHDLQTEDDPTSRYLRWIGSSVEEAIEPDPAPLYVVMDQDRAALFETLSGADVRDFLYDPQMSLSTLWSETRAKEVAA